MKQRQHNTENCVYCSRAVPTTKRCLIEKKTTIFRYKQQLNSTKMLNKCVWQSELSSKLNMTWKFLVARSHRAILGTSSNLLECFSETWGSNGIMGHIQDSLGLGHNPKWIHGGEGQTARGTGFPLHPHFRSIENFASQIQKLQWHKKADEWNTQQSLNWTLIIGKEILHQQAAPIKALQDIFK